MCVNYAGIPAGSFRTTDEAGVLIKIGAFDKYADDFHCKKSTNPLRGDILVTRSQGHTAASLSDGSKASEGVPLTPGCLMLKTGSMGTDIRELQEKLAALGNRSEVTVTSCLFAAVTLRRRSCIRISDASVLPRLQPDFNGCVRFPQLFSRLFVRYIL